MSAQSARLIVGDCREHLRDHGPYDLIIADPPYGETSFGWDQRVSSWETSARDALKLTGSMWVFGSMRYFMETGIPAGWTLAQDLVWEKPNGTGFAADRFKRVHEHLIHLYRSDSYWDHVHNVVNRVPRSHDKDKSATRKVIGHTGAIRSAAYVDDGLRIPRSVIKAPSVRGGEHGTEKPQALLLELIRTSCPPDGLVCDPFAGSGAVAEACVKLGRRYVGFERDPQIAEKAEDRIIGLRSRQMVG